MLATINAIADRLTDDRRLVYRYRAEAGVDGLAGEEGRFLLCTFWLAQALAMAGRVERAREVFERAAGYGNDVGLLAEEIARTPGSCWAISRRRSAIWTGQRGPGDQRGGEPYQGQSIMKAVAVWWTSVVMTVPRFTRYR